MNNNNNKFDKYLVGSNLQKSIRLGVEKSALSSVDCFYENDSKYLIYRLGTILMEDIGLANIDLVKEYLMTKLNYNNIEKLGGKEYIKKIVLKACNSNKDRTACDIAYLSSFFNDKDLQKLNNIEEVKFLINSWKELGFKKFKNIYYPTTNFDNLENYNKYLKINHIPENIIELINLGYNSSSENICLGFAPCYINLSNEILKKQKQLQIVEKKYNNNLLYDNLLDLYIVPESIDLHNKGGYEVLKMLLNNDLINNIFKKYQIKTFENKKDIIKHILFRTEGHNVNKRIFNPLAVKTMRQVECFILSKKLLINITTALQIFNDFKNTLNEEEIKNNIFIVRQNYINNKNLIDLQKEKIKY